MSDKTKKESPQWIVHECKFYKENSFHYLRKTGLLAINWFHGIWYAIHNGTVFLLLIVTCCLIFKDGFGEFVEIIHFAVLLLLTEVSMLIVPKDVLVEMIRLCDQGLCDYGTTLDEISIKEIEKLRTEMHKRKRFRVKFMNMGLYLATFVLNFVRSIYDYSIGKYENPNLLNKNVNRYLPVHMWSPFDVTQWYGQVFTFALQYYNTAVTTLVVIASATMFITFSEEICFQLSSMKVGLRYIKRRADEVAGGTANVQAFQECFKMTVIHHNNIVKLFDLHQCFFYWILWLIVTLCTYLICLSGFSLTMDSVKMNDIIVMAFFFFFEMLNILMICWYGEEIKSLGEDLRVVIYESDWLDYRVPLKNYMLIIQIRAMRPLQLTCGGLMDANLETFSNVCGSAYSYFNLLRASK